MEKVSPTVHLVIRSCIFCTTLVAFFTLLGANFYKISIRGKRLQTLALLFKLILDLIPVILTALNSSTSLEEGTTQFIDYILLCCSSTFITSFEHFFLWTAYDRASDAGFGWVIHRPGLAVTFVLNASLFFVPFIKRRNESYQFWTISGASCLHFSLFCFAHVWLANSLRSLARKWSRLASGYLTCLVVALSSLTSLFVGWKVLKARDLLPEILYLCTSSQLSIRICVIIATQARKKLREIPDGARKLRDNQRTGQNRRPSTSTSRKRLTRNTGSRDYTSDTVHPIPKESFSSIDPPTSPFKIFTSPRGWLPEMYESTLDLVSKGEDLTSIRILLETEWPELADHVDLVWLEHVARTIQQREQFGGSLDVRTRRR